tara:strand:+ start:4955 stop:6730 length:1776 start_codon:yes stop_codon:yes gene_type:complete
VITLLLGSVSFFTSTRTTNYFENVSLKREEEINFRLAIKSSLEVDRLIHSIIDKTLFYSQFLIQNTQNIWSEKQSDSMKNDSDIVSISIFQTKNLSKPVQNTYQKSFLKKYKLGPSFFSQFDISMLPLRRISNGEIVILSATRNQVPLIWIGIPILRDKYQTVTHIASVFIKQESLQKSYQDNGNYELFVLDELGNTLAHPNEEYVVNKKSFALDTLFKKASQSQLNSTQMIITKNKKRFLEAFAKSQFGPYIISSIAEESYIGPIQFVKKQSTFILVAVLFLSIVVITFFSNTLILPIEKLLSFTKEISQGNFDLDIAKNISSNDEVGVLASAFDEMTYGLKERDKIKNAMDKFHGAAITEDMLSGEVNLRGSSKDVVVFFSDIRSFTKYSESRSAEEVVSMLNEYMDVMVKCIYKHNGIVDKFVGDAIMAVWGVPTASELDVKNAVNACLDMRVELEKLNQNRIKRGEDPIMIGMGLNYGKVISGTVGSEDRMEYTVIGDTVNTAARIEASTKSFGTDLLISENVYNAVAKDFIFSEAGKVQAKGKSDSLKLIKVEGAIVGGQHIIIKTPYSHFEPEDEAGGKTQRVAL